MSSPRFFWLILALATVTTMGWAQTDAAPAETSTEDVRLTALSVAMKIVAVLLMLILFQLMRRRAQLRVEQMRESGRKPWEKRR